MSDDLGDVKILWVVLNSILVLYAIILFIYGRYCRHKDSLSLVIHIFFNLFFIHIEKYSR
jgi:hypothetical protein